MSSAQLSFNKLHKPGVLHLPANSKCSFQQPFLKGKTQCGRQALRVYLSHSPSTPFDWTAAKVRIGDKSAAALRYGAMLATAAAMVMLPVDQCAADPYYGASTEVQGVSVQELGGKKKSSLNKRDFFLKMGLSVALTLGSTIALENSGLFPSIEKANKQSADRKKQGNLDEDLPEFDDGSPLQPLQAPPTTMDSVVADARGGLDMLQAGLAESKAQNAGAEAQEAASSIFDEAEAAVADVAQEGGAPAGAAPAQAPSGTVIIKSQDGNS